MREPLITDAVVADPKSRYGDGKASTRHFITQRVSGAINVAFLLLLLFVVVRLAGQDRPDMVAVIGNGWIGLPLALLVVIACIHMRNGMRDVLEDYFQGAAYRRYMLANTLFCLAVGLVGVVSILKLVFWG